MKIKCPYCEREMFINNQDLRIALLQYIYDDMKVSQLIKWMEKHLIKKDGQK